MASCAHAPPTGLTFISAISFDSAPDCEALSFAPSSAVESAAAAGASSISRSTSRSVSRSISRSDIFGMIVEVQPALPPTFSLMSPVGHARRRPTQRISHFRKHFSPSKLCQQPVTGACAQGVLWTPCTDILSCLVLRPTCASAEVTSAFLAVVLLVNAFTPVEYELSTRCTPAPSYHVRALASRFVFLSYRKPDEPLYYKGRDDGFFITFWVFVFIFLREALMRWVLTPLASASGVKKYRYVTRFAEQGWSVVYYTASWAVGTVSVARTTPLREGSSAFFAQYIMHHAPYRYLIDTSSFYQGYPHGEALDRLNKLYYLLQVAFWIQVRPEGTRSPSLAHATTQQLIVLHLEQRRNDFRQMLCHHLVTVALVTLSYVWNWTRVGNAVSVQGSFTSVAELTTLPGALPDGLLRHST